ncbi:MAG: hypothetical protein N2689_09415 [Verrucomicrobiae bacterium]|nr:hypothetical protein [Verrucomicrobiae bacterium]
MDGPLPSRPNQFFHVDALAHPGTGKLDLRKMHHTASQLAGILKSA